MEMLFGVVLIALIHLSWSIPAKSLHKRSTMRDIYFSENWRDLFNYYDKICSPENANKILKWTEDCIYLCDGNGNPLFLDRKKNEFDVGLGSYGLDHRIGVPRQSSDDKLYEGDACPDGSQTQSLIEFGIMIERNNPYVIICNDESKVEFLSLRFSWCPGNMDDEEFKPPPPVIRIEDGDCLHTVENSTVVDLVHEEFRSSELYMNKMVDEKLCRYEYCCHAIKHYFTASCGIDDFCDRGD